MTKLTKSVKRETLYTSVQHGKRRGRPVFVELQPGDILSFRIKGTRQRTDVSLMHCYNLAQIITTDRLYREKLKTYEDRKKLGIRGKKPKKPSGNFNKLYYSSFNSK